MDDILKEIDSYIENLIEPWKVPGLAVGIIKDKKVVFKKGYGIRDIESKEKVETSTAFAIGSVSKSFTSASVAVLIRQGKIKSWDDKVIEYLPNYKASDEYAQNNMTIKDLLSMRSGYSVEGWDNMLFHGSHYTMDEIIDKSQFIPFDLKFRDRMRYDNLNFIIAGKIVEVLSGLKWHEFIEKELLSKLNMNSSGATYEFAINNKEAASPHLYFDGTNYKINWRNIDNAGPAGSIVSSVDDMMNWAFFQLSDGDFNGNAIIDKKDMIKMHTPHTVIDKELFKSSGFEDVLVPSYGLGWFINELNGISCIGHGGHIDGFSSYVHLAPEHDLGIVILANADHNSIYNPIIRTVTDKLCGKQMKFDYNKFYLKDYTDGINNMTEEYKKLLKKCNNENIAIEELQKYCGTYMSKLFDTQKVEIRNQKMYVERHDWKGELLHMENDTFIAIWNNDLTHPPLKFKFIKEDGIYRKIEVDMFGEFIRED